MLEAKGEVPEGSLGRDENRQMRPAQIARFEALRDRLAG